MKYLHFTLVVLLFVSLLSCSKNDDSPKPGGQLVGTWKMTSFTYTGATTTIFDGESITTPFSGTGKEMNVHISFAANPNTFTSTGDYTVELTMDAGGQQIKQDFPIQGFMGSGSWSREGNKLSVTDEATGKLQLSTIVQLDDKTLKVQWGGALDATNPYDMQETMVVNGTYVFARE